MRKVEPNTEALAIANERFNDAADSLCETLTDGIDLGADFEATIIAICELADDVMRSVCERYGPKDVPGEIGAQIAVVGHTCRNLKTVLGMMSIKNRITDEIIKANPDTDPSTINIDMDALYTGERLIIKRANEDKFREFFEEEDEE